MEKNVEKVSSGDEKFLHTSNGYVRIHYVVMICLHDPLRLVSIT